MKLLGALAQGGIVLLDKEPGNLILAQVVVGRGSRLVGDRGTTWKSITTLLCGAELVGIVLRVTVCCHDCFWLKAGRRSRGG